MHDTILSHMHRRSLGPVACGLLACLVAPPVVRSAERGQVSDSGGCNGGRSVPAATDEGEETTTEAMTTSETGEPSTGVEGACGDGKVDEGEGCDDGNKEDGDGCPSGAAGRCAA